MILNSDAITQTFGSYGVAVLAQTDTTRLANLYSLHEGQRICRTLALTQFANHIPAALGMAHESILAGSSIGATLADAGFAMQKIDPEWFTLLSGDLFEELSGHSVRPGTPLAVQTYALCVEIDGDCVPYATLAEAYHPAHISCGDRPIARGLPDTHNAAIELLLLLNEAL
jgi:hypothetical protein